MTAFGDVELLAIDVDGTQTDGSMVVYEDKTIKFCNARDGLATNLLIRCGVRVYWLSGGYSRAVETRAAAMGITGLRQGCSAKGTVLAEIAEREGLPLEKCAYMGDDLNDIPAIRAAGIGIAVGDAAPECIAAADYVTRHPGGRGAVRETAELILKGKGLWEDIIANFEKYLISDKQVH